MVPAIRGLTKGLTVFKNWIPAAVMVAAAFLATKEEFLCIGTVVV